MQVIAQQLCVNAGVGQQRFSMTRPVHDSQGSNQHLGNCRMAFRTSAPFADAWQQHHHSLGPAANSRLLHAFEEEEEDYDAKPVGVHRSILTQPSAHPTAANSSTDGPRDELVRKIPGDPDKWPLDQTRHMVIQILSLRLHAAWVDAGFEQVQVFWNMLDQLAEADTESTQRTPVQGPLVSMGDTTLYSLNGHTQAHIDAQVCPCSHCATLVHSNATRDTIALLENRLCPS